MLEYSVKYTLQYYCSTIINDFSGVSETELVYVRVKEGNQNIPYDSLGTKGRARNKRCFVRMAANDGMLLQQ